MTKYGEHKKEDLVGRLKISNLLGLFVPEVGANESVAIVSCPLLFKVLDGQGLLQCALNGYYTRKW